MTRTFGKCGSAPFRLALLIGGLPIAMAMAMAMAMATAVAMDGQAADRRLLMFDAHDCPFCERWRVEVGVVYHKTREGGLAPLEQTALDDPLPSGVTLAEPVRYTPTFVLLNTSGTEIGRITGYLGEDQFWGLLGMLLPSAQAQEQAQQQAQER